MTATSIPFQAVYPGERLFLDYVAGAASARQLFTGDPASLWRPGYSPRRPPVGADLSRSLATYNRRIGADALALSNVNALAESSTLCVITGQQVCLLGGPVYSLYKIATAVQVARELASRLNRTVVPVFWLASEDHDFHEANSTAAVGSDGEVHHVAFGWKEQGRSVSDLPVDEAVMGAVERYFDLLGASPDGELRERFRPRGGLYSEWVAGLWARLFAGTGLVVLEPWLLRPFAEEFFTAAIEQRGLIATALERSAARLQAAGYPPALEPQRAGRLFTYDKAGLRVRLEGAPAGRIEPTRLSPDASLRPLLADSLLPTVATVLGPGEVAYQAMLQPLYSIMQIQQPVIYPRKSFTAVSDQDVSQLAAANASVGEVLKGTLIVPQLLAGLSRPEELSPYDRTLEKLGQAFAPLRDLVAPLDPNLTRTWERSLAHARLSVRRLQQRAQRAQLAGRGHRPQQLQRIRNTLRPRNRLQERLLPAPHFLAAFGSRFVAIAIDTGEVGVFEHLVLQLPPGGSQ